MRRDTLVQTIAAAGAIVALGASALLGAQLTSSAGQHKLVYTDRAEDGDPPQVAVGIAMGAFRGVFVNFLWLRANTLKEEGKFYEALELARAITRLQPRFPQVWVFHAWNMAYNISVSTHTPDERWQWVQSGIRLLRDEAIPANPNDMLLHKELAWIYLHKIAGITDDANQFYKRKVAEEWTINLGEPPPPTPKDRSTANAIDRYVAWLTPVAEAARTPEELARRSPAAAALQRRIQTEVGDPPDRTLLRRYERLKALERSAARRQVEATMGPNNTVMLALMRDAQYAEAWPELLAFVRRKTLTADYRMDPLRMIRYTRKYGPIDWRHPAAHSLYWGAKGVEEALGRWHEGNKRDFDFINSDRIVIQSLQELYRSGEIYFNFLEFTNGLESFYLASVNPHFVDSYGGVLAELVQRSWADQPDRPFTVYAAGYENFLKDAVRFFYRRGQFDEAERHYQKLGTLTIGDTSYALMNDPMRAWDYSRPLQEFVHFELQNERILSAYVAVSEIVGALQGAYASGLLGDDEELFRAQFDFARTAHAFYMQRQLRETVAMGAQAGRTEFLDRDFRIVAGQVFRELVMLVPVADASAMYNRAPEDLRRFVYDLLVEVHREPMDALAREQTGESFNDLFPEPPGMTAHRAMMEQRARERAEQRIDVAPK